MYAEGLGVDQSNVSAVYWFCVAADRGHPEAQFILGMTYYTGGVERNIEEDEK